MKMGGVGCSWEKGGDYKGLPAGEETMRGSYLKIE